MCGESDVAFVVGPDGQRIPIRDEDPPPDVELAGADDQRILDIFLHYLPAF